MADDRRGAWRRAFASVRPAVAIVALVTALLSPGAQAFKIASVTGSPPNHENITASAIRSVMPAADPLMIRNIQQGVINTDLAHVKESEFHFDNSTATNGGFDNGFTALSAMALGAHAEAMLCDGTHPCGILNPLFVHPQHSSYRDLVTAIMVTYWGISATAGCLHEPACWGEDLEGKAARLQSGLLPVLIDHDPDPDDKTVVANGTTTGAVSSLDRLVAHAKSDLDSVLGAQVCRPWPHQGLCFVGMGGMAPRDNLFHLLVGQLEVLQLEYQAYFAWQHLGHAFHITQDFFAHSNYIELASCRKGPPCATNSYNAAGICDVPLDGSPGSENSLPLPTDGRPLQDLTRFFLPNFSVAGLSATLNAQPAVFAEGNGAHLQTGNFPCTTDPPDAGFQYCHTAKGEASLTAAGRSATAGTAGPAGLNKDEEFTSGAELNHRNYPWAERSAERTSVALFASFMYSFPDGPAQVATNPLAAAAPSGARPSCGIAVDVAPTRPVTALAAPEGSGSASPPKRGIVRPYPPALLTRAAPPARSAAIVPAPLAAQRPLSHPELLLRDPRPRFFATVSPNRAFRPGERVQLRVDAYDAASGAPLSGMPVRIGAGRGTTGTPFDFTIPASAQPRCINHDGPTVCLGTFASVPGKVDDPAGRYPGGGGEFSLSITAPHLRVMLNGGPAVLPGTTAFNVSALDSQSDRPVAGATVLVADRIIGPANAPLTYSFPVPAPVGPPPLAAPSVVMLGAPMIVRAPGYSDELVHYYVVPPGTPLPPR